MLAHHTFGQVERGGEGTSDLVHHAYLLPEVGDQSFAGGGPLVVQATRPLLTLTRGLGGQRRTQGEEELASLFAIRHFAHSPDRDPPGSGG